MGSKVRAHEVFDDLPCWDSSAEQAHHIVFEAWTLPSESASLPMSSELSSSVIWDEELTLDFESHGLEQLAHEEFEHNPNLMSGDDSYLLQQDFVVPDASQMFVGMSQVSADQLFKEMPLEATWDEKMHSDVHLHEGFLKQHAQGRNCFVGMEGKRTGQPPDTNYLHTAVVFPKYVECINSVRAAHEMFHDMSTENVIWDEEVMLNQNTHDLLQLLASGREHLDSKHSKIIEGDDVEDIIWDEDLSFDFYQHHDEKPIVGLNKNDVITHAGDSSLLLVCVVDVVAYRLLASHNLDTTDDKINGPIVTTQQQIWVHAGWVAKSMQLQ